MPITTEGLAAAKEVAQDYSRMGYQPTISKKQTGLFKKKIEYVVEKGELSMTRRAAEYRNSLRGLSTLSEEEQKLENSVKQYKKEIKSKGRKLIQ